MGPPYFDFYDSFNAPIAHAQANDVKAFEHEFEKQLQKGAIRGRLGISWWFFKRYFYELTSRSIIAVLLLVMLIGLMSGALPKYLSAAVIGLTSSAVGATTPNTAAGQMPTKRPPNGSGSVPSAIKKNPVNERLIQEREALRKQLSDEKQKNERLQKELQDASAIILISTKSITLRGIYI